MGSYESKLRERFVSFDQDGDGSITQDDMRDMALRICTEFGVAPSSPDGQALLSGADQYFQGLADIADVDRDGRISEEEFVAAASERLRGKPDGFAQVLGPWAEAVGTIADVDSDGQLPVSEWERMLVAMGMTAERAHDRAEQVDADGDGTVTVAEVIDTAVQYYTSDNRMPDFAASR